MGDDMSAKATFWAWEQAGIYSSAKLVLLCLADCHNADSDRCDPSISHISEKTCLDRKTVMKAVQNLTEIGLIIGSKRYGAATNYLLNFAETSTKNGTGVKVESGTKNGTASSANIGTSTESGTSTKNGTRTSTKNGTRPVPKTVHKPKRNLQENLKDINIITQGGDFDAEQKQQKSKAKKTPIHPAMTLPEEWKKTASVYWQENNRSDINPEQQFFKFKNYHLAKGSLMLDWSAAWRTWYANATGYTNPAPQAQASQRQAHFDLSRQNYASGDL